MTFLVDPHYHYALFIPLSEASVGGPWRVWGEILQKTTLPGAVSSEAPSSALRRKHIQQYCLLLIVFRDYNNGTAYN